MVHGQLKFCIIEVYDKHVRIFMLILNTRDDDVLI